LHTLNLGILAHVDAGKTSLTERLLFTAGAIAELGSVDAGTTRTDSMDIERSRGITVRTNVASFASGDVQVNLIDTPGHSDFIAEVERSLAVLDAAVLVVSAVEGVQPQTVVLWRVLRRLAVPTSIFINKIDRQGADPDRVLAEIGRRLTAGSGARPLPLTDVPAPGSPGASTKPVPLTDPRPLDVLASGDDRLLRAAVAGPAVTAAMAERSARAQAGRGVVVPVTAGSALTGAGVPDLLAALPRLMPWARPATSELSGVIYKIEHGDHGTLAHCRLFGGELHVRDRAAVSTAVSTARTTASTARTTARTTGSIAQTVPIEGAIRANDPTPTGSFAQMGTMEGTESAIDPVEAVGVASPGGSGRPARPEVVTSIERTTPDGWAPANVARAGDVVRIRGIGAARTGSWVGAAIPGRVARQFPAPALESVVEPVKREERGRLFQALKELAEADPLINLRVNEDRAEIAVSLYGEVQKEVIADLLEGQFGVAVTFRPTVTVHIERIAGTGASFAIMAEKTTPYLATLGFRVEPAPIGAGLVCDLAAERGSMPPAFFAAAWEGVRYALAQGRSGWAIPDARVTLTHTGYAPRQSAMHQKFNKNISSVGADFRNLAPVLIHEALRQARTVVCEPVETFHLEIPVTALPVVTVTLGRLSGLITGTSPAAEAADILALTGTLPTRSVQPLLAQLPEQTSGEGVFTSEVTHYTPVAGPPPARARSGPDPLDRETWFRARPR
jgi:ribosomal protection tetracycline resistance protein